MFSHGGQFLLTNEKSKIIVYDTIYFETVYVFQEHTIPISKFLLIDDRYVISNCANGKLFFWEISIEEKPSGKKSVPESPPNDSLYLRTYCHDQSKPYEDFQFDQDNDLFVGCFNEKNLLIYKNNCKDLLMEYVNEECSYTKLLLSLQHGVIFCGTSRGSIRTHLWPPVVSHKTANGYKKSGPKIDCLEHYEFSAHLYPINHLVLTPDMSQLITASTDGMMLILKVNGCSDQSDLNEQKQMIDEKGGISQTINDLFIVKKTKLKEQND